MWTRRQFLCRGTGSLLALSGGILGYRALSQDGQPRARNTGNVVTRQAERAIARGLAYLARRQTNEGAFGTGNYRGDVAVTSLAGLAFMAGGSQAGRGPYGENVTRAIEYVLNQEYPNYRGQHTPGFLCNRFQRARGPMYGHGFGTLFLAECYGMVHDADLRRRLRTILGRAVRLIIRSQNDEGGWRYYPSPPQSADISVTICQIMALRAARNAGFAVPNSTVRHCIQYVKDCQDLHFDGGFRYMKHGGPTGFARTAAGVVALNSAGIYKGEEVSKGLDYLRRYRPGAEINPPFGGFNQREMELHFYYGHYYAVQAMWIAGGRYWREWFPAIREELLRRQQRDGSWSDNRTCPHYCTAMACIILQIPNNYLPIFQR